MEYDIKVSNYIVQYADQHESVHEFHQLHNKTNSAVKISENIEEKASPQCTVEVCIYFSKLRF